MVSSNVKCYIYMLNPKSKVVNQNIKNKILNVAAKG